MKLKQLTAVVFVGLIVSLLDPAARWGRHQQARAQASDRLPLRVPWTTGRITGSPEPPPAYQTVRAFANLTFQNPLDISYFPDGQRVAVLEEHGKLYSFRADDAVKAPDLLIDLNTVRGLDKIKDCKGVGEAYGIAFHPKFAQNHYLYVCYTLDYTTHIRNHENGSRVSRFTISQSDPPTIDPQTEVIVLKWPQGGHNGGCVKFGADGYLYISTGDAGDPNPPDPFETGQDITDLLSSILRIDVDHPGEGRLYSIPTDNPFAKTPGARPEVYAYGLRNPWRMNFDHQTHQLWVGDVGWELWESVYCVKPASNFGWSIMEGPNPIHLDGKRGPTPITPPAVALPHTESDSVTGGTVYRGHKFPNLIGSYVFGDWQTRTLWAAKVNGDKLEPYHIIAQTDEKIVAFGEDPQGELIIVDHGGGGLWRIAPNDAVNQPRDFPRRLSQTGLFTALPQQTPQPGVIPFSINAPQWVDGAMADRWVALPGAQVMGWGKGAWGDDKPAWPKDSVLVRTLSLGEPSHRKHVETQVLHFDGKQWQAYAYAWNDEQTDAELIDAGGDDRVLVVPDSSAPGGTSKQRWHFAARAQCLTCHNVWCDYALAFNPGELDRDGSIGGVTANQVRAFRQLGFLLEPRAQDSWRDPNAPPAEKAALTNPYDESGDLNERARSYLHVNCSECHRFGGGGSALFDVRKELHRDEMKLLNVPANLGAFALDDPYLACAGDPARSTIVYRMSKLGRDRMPRIGSDLVDVKGVDLLRRWIEGLETSTSPSRPSDATKSKAQYALALRGLADADPSSTQAIACAQQLLSSPSGALALLGAIDRQMLASPTRAMVIAQGIKAPQDAVRDLFRRFDPNERKADRLGAGFNPAKLLAIKGDAEHGREIFFKLGGTGLCARCHIVNHEGTDLGPDLTHIAAKYNRADLLDNIIYPSKTIAPGYATYIVRTKSGDTYSGFLLKQTDQEIVLKDAQLKQIHLPATDIEKMAAQPLSAMPEGLLSDLEWRQASDLLAFLGTLK